MKRWLRIRRFGLPCCVAMGLLAFMPAGVGAEPPRLKELLDIVRAQEEAAKAEAQAARMSLMQEALKLAQQDKEVARDELQKVTKARAELRHKINVRNWALDSFEAHDRGLTPPARVSKYLSHLETVRSVYRKKFLAHPYASRGEVKSGKALNFFLDACGSVALNHQLLRDQIPDLLVQPDLSPTRKQELLDWQDSLVNVGGKNVLTDEQRQRIRYQVGLTGSKLVIDARDGVMPLHWPVVLTTNAEFRPYMDVLEAAKESALTNLRDGKPVAPKTQGEMLEAADEIKLEFQRYQERLTNRPPNADAVNDWVIAKNFVKGLRSDVSCFVAARRISDLEPTEKFYGERIEDLLAFMARHGYRFAEANADPLSQAAYQVLYTQMVDYYTGLYTLQLAVQSDVRDEQDLTQRAEKLFQNGYRNTMDDLTASLQARPPLHWSEILKNVGDGVSGIGQGVRDFRKNPRN